MPERTPSPAPPMRAIASSSWPGSFLAQILPRGRPGHPAFFARPPRQPQQFARKFARRRAASGSHRRCRMRRMHAADRRVTYAEMLEWPDDGRRYELYDGEVIVVPSPVLRHQRIALHVMDVLRDHEEAAGGAVVPAPFDIVFS